MSIHSNTVSLSLSLSLSFTPISLSLSLSFSIYLCPFFPLSVSLTLFSIFITLSKLKTLFQHPLSSPLLKLLFLFTFFFHPNSLHPSTLHKFYFSLFRLISFFSLLTNLLSPNTCFPSFPLLTLFPSSFNLRTLTLSLLSFFTGYLFSFFLTLSHIHSSDVFVVIAHSNLEYDFVFLSFLFRPKNHFPTFLLNSFFKERH